MLNNWLHIPAAFSRAECLELCDLLESISWKQATVLTHVSDNLKRTVAVKPAQRKQFSHAVFNSQPIEQILQLKPTNKLEQWAQSLIKHYQKYEGMLNVHVSTVEMMDYQKSLEGDYFNWHPDTIEGMSRVLSVFCYLSDKESHNVTGGETEWVIDGEIISVTPQVGDVIVFDAKLVHRGCLVKSGIKYCALCIFGHDDKSIV